MRFVGKLSLPSSLRFKDLRLETCYIRIVWRLAPRVIGSRRETATSYDGLGARFEWIATTLFG